MADKKKRAAKGTEGKAREQAAESPAQTDILSPEETRLMLHELQVHQIELEMQNEELRKTQVDLQAARARYFDLFDLAPVGYFSLSDKGLVLQANLAAAALLGVARGALVKQPLTRFILKEDQDIYYLRRKRLLESGEPQSCMLRIVRESGTEFPVHLVASAAQDSSGAPLLRIVMIRCDRGDAAPNPG